MNLSTPSRLSDRQRAWIDNRLGRRLPRGADVPHNRNRIPTHGLAVDYKIDVAGIGVYFVLDLGAEFGADRYVERYYKLPPA